ncbi:MAG: hypothetical protein Q7S84_01610 [bacterium]|nr:hypothetical protein [bacterium]
MGFFRRTKQKKRTLDVRPTKPHHVWWRFHRLADRSSVSGPAILNLRKAIERRYRREAVALALVLAVALFFQVPGIMVHAEVVDFYPGVCLGTWVDASHAQSVPESWGSSSAAITEETSAYIAPESVSIFCGEFIPPSFEASSVESIDSVGLTIVWRMGVLSVTDDLQPTPHNGNADNSQAANTATSTGQSPAINEQTTNEQLTTPTSSEAGVGAPTENVGADGQLTPALPPPSVSEIPPVSPTSSPTEQSPATNEQPTPPVSEPLPVESAPSEPPAPTSTAPQSSRPALFARLVRAVHAQEAPPENPPVSAPAETPAPETPPRVAPSADEPPVTAPPAPEAPPAEPAPATSTERIPTEPTPLIDPNAPAGSTDNPLIVPFDATSSEQQPPVEPRGETSGTTEGSPLEATSTSERVEVQVVPDENFLAVTYSMDGRTWFELGRVNLTNWEHFTVELPITTLDALSHLQVRIERISTTMEPYPEVHLDGMFLEMRYTRSLSIADLMNEDKDAEKKPREVEQPTIVTTIPSNVPLLDSEFTSIGSQACSIEPFSVGVPRGGMTNQMVYRVPNDPGAPFQLLTGKLPGGIHATFTPPFGVGDVSTTMNFVADASAVPGSYSIIVAYREQSSDGAVTTATCQANLVVE